MECVRLAVKNRYAHAYGENRIAFGNIAILIALTTCTRDIDRHPADFPHVASSCWHGATRPCGKTRDHAKGRKNFWCRIVHATTFHRLVIWPNIEIIIIKVSVDGILGFFFKFKILLDIWRWPTTMILLIGTIYATMTLLKSRVTKRFVGFTVVRFIWFDLKENKNITPHKSHGWLFTGSVVLVIYLVFVRFVFSPR